MSETLWRGAALAALLSVAGCVTEARDVPEGSNEFERIDDPEPSAFKLQEERLKEAADDYPDNPKVWYELGRFYEEHYDFPRALRAYREMDRATDVMVAEHNETAEQPVAFTTGDFHIGKVFYEMDNHAQAIPHLQAVLALQPDDPQDAALAPGKHWTRAHYMLGDIYYQGRQWELAEDHFRAFKALGGDPAEVDYLLMNVAYHMEQEEKGASR